MNLRPLFSSILTFFAEQFLKAGDAIHPLPASTNPVTPNAAKQILPIAAADGTFVGPWKHAPAVPLVHGQVPLPIVDPSRIVSIAVAPSTTETILAEAILKQNGALAFDADGVVPNPFKGTPLDKGSVIHKIDSTQAREIAAESVRDAYATGLDLPFLLGSIAIESAFDPAAENGNFLGSNKAKALSGYDLGLCQLKLEYLMGIKDIDGKTVQTVVEAHDLALDIRRAIPVMVLKLLGLLAWADKEIPKLTVPVNPLFRNRYYLAAAGYNFGEDGALAEISKGEDLTHCAHVKSLTTNFAKMLSVQNVFAPVG